MAECIYDLDGPDDLPENPKLVEFLCTEPDKPPPEVQDHLEVIDLGTEEDPRPMQVSGLLETNDRAKIVCLLQEFKDCFAWHYTKMPVRCCVDYRNINGAIPKHEYPMPMADLSIDAVAKHKVLSFMDGNAGYNQINMAQEDTHKTAFRCPGHVGAYEYLVMPFGLKNVGATYQRVMNAIFHDLIGHSMEVYIDDIMVKSKTEEQHLIDLKQALTRMRIHKLKMNPKKCAFGVRAGIFLGFLVHQRGRIGKWILTLSEFSFQYVPQRAVKGQAIADFLAEHQESQDEIVNIPGILEKASRAGIVIINPQGVHHYYSFLLDYQRNTNNQAEYEALIIGLEILIELGAMEVEVFGDSKLMINQLNGEYKCRHITMVGYYLATMQLLSYWDSKVSVNHVPRESNLVANEMAQIASRVPIQEWKYGVDVEIQRRNLPSILERGFSLDVMVLETETEDW
ncbi:unnamed protein product [Malus baccata var. baccata]